MLVDDYKMFRTTTAKYTFNPVWNERREFKTNIRDQISFSIVDEKKKSILAECHISIDDLLIKHIKGEPMQMKKPLIPQGDLHLESLLEGNASLATWTPSVTSVICVFRWVRNIIFSPSFIC